MGKIPQRDEIWVTEQGVLLKVVTATAENTFYDAYPESMGQWEVHDTEDWLKHCQLATSGDIEAGERAYREKQERRKAALEMLREQLPKDDAALKKAENNLSLEMDDPAVDYGWTPAESSLKTRRSELVAQDNSNDPVTKAELLAIDAMLAGVSYDEVTSLLYDLASKYRAWLILYPSEYFDTKKIDPDFAAEREAAQSIGCYQTAVMNYDDWLQGEPLCITPMPQRCARAIYRGWMLKPEQYRNLYQDLLSYGIELVTKPWEYNKFHLFPNIYPDIQANTARMLAYPAGVSVPVDEVKKQFTRFMVKDYVKSVKDTNFPQYFDQSVTQEEFDRWMQVFYKYRDNLFTGGICVKEYLDLRRYEGRPNEFRVFYMGGRVSTVSRNSLQGEYTPTPPKALLEKYENLGSPFYTLDVAELEDGTWKILEAGDGQVSGLSDGQDAKAFYRSLYYAFSD